MKISIIAIIAYLLLISVNALAGGLTKGVQWMKGPSGYGTKVYVGMAPGDLHYSYDGGVDTDTFTIPDLLCESTYYAAATHYADLGDGLGMQESSLCPEVSFTTGACMTVTFNPMPSLPDPIVLPVNLFNLP